MTKLILILRNFVKRLAVAQRNRLMRSTDSAAAALGKSQTDQARDIALITKSTENMIARIERSAEVSRGHVVKVAVRNREALDTKIHNNGLDLVALDNI